MLNHAMEIHDATLEARTTRPGSNDLVLVFSAFVHQSSGEPGVDAGHVTRERIELRITEAKLRGEFPQLPCRMEEGQGEMAGEAFANLLPIPLVDSEPFEVELLALTGEEFIVKGKGAILTVLSRPSFIDLEAHA